MQKAYALFDFDGTIISGDSIVMLCRYAHRRGLCTAGQLAKSVWAALRYVLRLSTAEQSKAVALAFLQGQTQAELYSLSSDFCRDVLRPRFRKQALEELAMHRTNGTEILLITASPSFYFEPIAAELGVKQVIGTRIDVTDDGVFTGFISGENCKGVQKPLRLAEYLASTGDRLEYDTSYAYGDSLSDLPMLALCRHKVGVNAKRKLKAKLKPMDGATFVRWRG